MIRNNTVPLIITGLVTQAIGQCAAEQLNTTPETVGHRCAERIGRGHVQRLRSVRGQYSSTYVDVVKLMIMPSPSRIGRAWLNGPCVVG